jgi:hypothetical protein
MPGLTAKTPIPVEFKISRPGTGRPRLVRPQCFVGPRKNRASVAGHPAPRDSSSTQAAGLEGQGPSVTWRRVAPQALLRFAARLPQGRSPAVFSPWERSTSTRCVLNSKSPFKTPATSELGSWAGSVRRSTLRQHHRPPSPDFPAGWGGCADGKTFAEPGSLAKKAFAAPAPHAPNTPGLRSLPSHSPASEVTGLDEALHGSHWRAPVRANRHFGCSATA